MTIFHSGPVRTSQPARNSGPARNSRKVHWKRWLYLSHRWVGIVLCLLFAAWFVSGIVMMYVGFPNLDRDERLPGLPTLNFSAARLSPAAAVARLHEGDFSTVGAPDGNSQRAIADPTAPLAAPSAMRLGMLFDRPVYRVEVRGAQPRVVFADNGEILRAVTPSMAQWAVDDFIQRREGKSVHARHIELRQTDQWTLSGNLNAHRPLHRVALDDAAGREFYVSTSTGEVVRDTARRERLLNYVGAVTHWIYPTVIRRHPAFWVWLVDIVASAGVLLAISGLWIGVLRWKPRAGKSSVPYRGVMRWHYFTGIGFGLFTLTWVFSGLMSMNPGGLNAPRVPSAAEKAVTTGLTKALRASDFAQLPPAFAEDTVEAELLHYDGRPFYLLTARDGARQLLDARTGAPARTDVGHLIALAPALLPNAAPPGIDLLQDYDDYYYSRHPERGGKPLPALRVRFADDNNTWFHIDVLSGQLIERSTTANRAFRWLYNGLHSWDFYWLWQHRPLWDIAVIAFSLGGLLLSVLGVVVGWRRLKRALSLGA